VAFCFLLFAPRSLLFAFCFLLDCANSKYFFHIKYLKYYALQKRSPINIQINIKTEGPYHKSQQDLPYLVSHFHLDIGLDIDWRTFL
jgi:hypothetical protein